MGASGSKEGATGSSSVLRWFREQHEKVGSPVPLALFRIFFALALICEVGQIIYFREFLFDRVPFVVADPSFRSHLLWSWLALSFLLLIGFGTRFVAAALYGIHVTILGHYFMGRALDWHVDGVFISCAFLLIFMPSDRVLSVRRYLEIRLAKNAGQSLPVPPRVRPIWGLVLAFMVATLYLDSILWKGSSQMWLGGLGLWAPASFPFCTYYDLSLLLDQKWLVIIAGYVTVAFELLFPFLIWFDKPKVPLIVLGLVLHLGIAVVFPIPIFSLLMLSLYLGFIPVSAYGRSFRRWEQAVAPCGASADKGQDDVRRASRLSLAVLSVWTAALVIIAFASPFFTTHFEGVQIFKKLNHVGWTFKNAVYPWTGLSTHGVFMDAHYHEYRSQLLVAYREGDQETFLPMTTVEGTAGLYAWNRMWVTWTFNSAKPSLPPAQRMVRVRRWAAFWAGDTGIDPSAGEFVIYERPVKVSLWEYVDGLLRDNRQRPWNEVGKFTMRPDGSP